MSVLALCGGTAFSQSQLDAFKYSQTELNGTARYLGMGGAFGALGGDISAMNTNRQAWRFIKARRWLRH